MIFKSAVTLERVLDYVSQMGHDDKMYLISVLEDQLRNGTTLIN
jgi:hypothetical protein